MIPSQPILGSDFCSKKPPVPNDNTNSMGTSGKIILASWIAIAVGFEATIPLQKLKRHQQDLRNG
jgi:hypothetical protein